jgi:Calcineurin-like phosphoesterase
MNGKKKQVLTILCCAFFALVLKANHDPSPTTDYSKAGVDGPHVFYKGGKIVVKSVVLEDTIPVGRKSVYKDKSDILLTCNIPETGDAFSFSLMDSIVLAPAVYPATMQRILVLSDIEGNFLALKTMLLGAKVIDDKFNWTFGKGHLVLLGDFFDRGVNVTECLWLIYKLEKEAALDGGVVHFILGNHEVMNMANDTRYVRNKYFANAELISEEYQEWFSANTELGLWLRSKNAMEQIGDYMFCHGGISPAVTNSRLDMETVNRLARRWYGKPVKTITDPDAALIFDDKIGIFWYREMARNKADKDAVTLALDKFKVSRLILGHTLVSDVLALYRGKVICIDLFHEENIRQGFMKTLFIDKGLFYGLDSRGEMTSLVMQ